MAEDILRRPEQYGQNVHQNQRKDGSLVWMSWTNSPIHDEAGELIELLAIGNDLSRLKQTEAALSLAIDQLKESETLYRTLVELAPDAVLVHQNRRIVFANAEALRLCGANHLDELLGRDVIALVPAEDRSALLDRVERTQRGEPTPARELRLATLDGRCVPVEARATTIHIGGHVAAQVVIRDITERKRAEVALRESELRFRALFNSLIEGFAVHEVVCDECGEPIDFRFVEINPAVERLTGLGRGSLGKLHNEVLPDDDPKFVQIYGRLALTGESVQFENYSPALKRWYKVAAFSPSYGHFATLFEGPALSQTTRHRKAVASTRTSLGNGSLNRSDCSPAGTGRLLHCRQHQACDGLQNESSDA